MDGVLCYKDGRAIRTGQSGVVFLWISSFFNQALAIVLLK
jgi:hypothetical protein